MEMNDTLLVEGASGSPVSVEVWECVIRHMCEPSSLLPRSVGEFAWLRALARTCRDLHAFITRSPVMAPIFREAFLCRWPDARAREVAESDMERAAYWLGELMQRDGSYIHPVLNDHDWTRISAALDHWDVQQHSLPLGEVFGLPQELCEVGKREGLLKVINLIAEHPQYGRRDVDDMENMFLDVLGLRPVSSDEALQALRDYPASSCCYGKPQPVSQHEQSTIDSLSAMMMTPAAPLTELRPKMDDFEWYLISEVPPYESELRYWVQSTYAGCCAGLFCVNYDKGHFGFITAAGNS